MANEYTKFNSFDNLYERFKNYIENLDFGKDVAYRLYYDKHLLAAVVGCIEGNIRIDVKNSSWYIWYGDNRVSHKIDGKNKFPYILFSICQFLKCNVEYYNFIIKYFNLWHNAKECENSEFSYDEYHFLDMQDNYKQLMTTLNMDIRNAGNNDDSYFAFSYEALCSVLMTLFHRHDVYN